tara:strand:+ start:1945 stop:2553 length:609 start_codon:yes stop_codon:yes gene_type:complete
MIKAKVREQIFINKNELDKIELDILNRRHIERYAMLRQYCSGVILDASCGCGYGTNIISKNPDVNKIIGIDIDLQSIEWAKNNFENSKTFFKTLDIKNIKDINAIKEFLNNKELNNNYIDVLISLETIEHLKNPEILNEMAENLNIKTLFISYPSKKTTHYNHFHFHDFIDDDIELIFKNYKVTDRIDLHREVRILKFEKNV